jgi:hypothetical protein
LEKNAHDKTDAAGGQQVANLLGLATASCKFRQLLIACLLGNSVGFCFYLMVCGVMNVV